MLTLLPENNEIGHAEADNLSERDTRLEHSAEQRSDVRQHRPKENGVRIMCNRPDPGRIEKDHADLHQKTDQGQEEDDDTGYEDPGPDLIGCLHGDLLLVL